MIKHFKITLKFWEKMTVFLSNTVKSKINKRLLIKFLSIFRSQTTQILK